MHLDTSEEISRERSPLLAAVAVGSAVLCSIAFINSGEIHHLLAALAFVAVAPAWYLLPVSLFTRPIGAQLKRQYYPKWAQLITGIGLALLFASLGLRWAA